VARREITPAHRSQEPEASTASGSSHFRRRCARRGGRAMARGHARPASGTPQPRVVGGGIQGARPLAAGGRGRAPGPGRAARCTMLGYTPAKDAQMKTIDTKELSTVAGGVSKNDQLTSTLTSVQSSIKDLASQNNNNNNGSNNLLLPMAMMMAFNRPQAP